MLSVKHDVSVDQQLGIRDIALITAAIAFALSNAAWLGERGHILLAFYALAVIVFSNAIGLSVGKLYEALYWGGLATFLVFLAITGGEIPPSQAICFGWGAVAATCGAIAGTARTNRRWSVALLSGMAACIAMTASIYIGERGISQLAAFDILCAAIIGGTLVPTVAFLRWMVDEKELKRPVLAAWLTLAICVGNFLVPYFK